MSYAMRPLVHAAALIHVSRRRRISRSPLIKEKFPCVHALA
jgi:hypothetical protein